MNTNSVQIQGTLQPDGQLVLDEKPNLPPGRVRVTVQPVVDYKETEMWKFFERLKAEQAAGTFVPRTQEEIDDYLATMRDDEERCQEIERIQEECQRQREQKASGEAE